MSAHDRTVKENRVKTGACLDMVVCVWCVVCGGGGWGGVEGAATCFGQYHFRPIWPKRSGRLRPDLLFQPV